MNCGTHKQQLNNIRLAKITLVLILGLMSACSIANKALGVVGLGGNNDLKTISIESVFNSNQDTPVALDILFIYDEKISETLSSINGPKWFQDKDALSKRYSDALDIVHLEIVPLSLVNKVALPKNKKNAHSILLFTNYRSTKGQYVAELSQFKALKIRLLKDAYELVEQDG